MKKKLDMMIVHALGTSSSIWSSKRPTSRTAIEFTSRQTKRTTHAFDVSVPEMIYINKLRISYYAEIRDFRSASDILAFDIWRHCCGLMDVSFMYPKV